MTARQPLATKPPRNVRAASIALALMACYLVGAYTPSRAEAGPYLKEIARFEEPVHAAQPKGTKDLYVVERAGRIMLIRAGVKRSRPVIDIRSRIESAVNEQGMLSIAPAPNFKRSRLLYAYYTVRGGTAQVLVELKLDKQGTRVLRKRGQPVSRLVMRMPDRGKSHNGSLLLFGPDGYLYVSTGDGGGAGDPDRTAQDLGSRLGKILRIDPRRTGTRPYSIPADNPFVDGPGGKADEIYAYGLRNPWRFSIDRKRNLIAIGDVGQNQYEEINVLPLASAAGANFGWSAFEASSPFAAGDSLRGPSPHTQPTYEYPHDVETGGFAVTGGLFVRDPALPSLYGRYLFADSSLRWSRSFDFEGGRASDVRSHPRLMRPAPVSFVEGNSGRIWLISLAGGIYRIVE